MKKLLILISLSILLTGCGYIDTGTQEHDNTIALEQTTDDIDLDVRTGRDLSLPTTDEINNEISTTTEVIEETIEMTTFIIDGTTYQLPYSENNSVYDAMMTLTAMSSQPFSFQAKEYPGLGVFVYEINGKKQDNKAGLYWIYYINNQSAKIGISNYIIQKGDIIEWKYEKSTF